MEALLEGVRLDVLATAHVHLQFERRVLGIHEHELGCSVGLPYGAEGPPAALLGRARASRCASQAHALYDVDEAIRRTEQSGIPTAELLVDDLREPPEADEADRRRRAARGVRLGRSQLDCRHRASLGQLRAAFRANEEVALPQDELGAHGAGEAGPAGKRDELLLERAVESRDPGPHRMLRNTPTTFPRTCT